MRVLHLIPSLEGSGGAERSLEALTPELARHVDFHIAHFSHRDGLGPVLEAAGATVHRLEATGWVQRLRALDRLVRELRPDLIHTTLIEADIIGRLIAMRRSTPVVSSLVNVAYGPEQFAEDPATIRAKRLGYWLVDALTARAVVRFHALTEAVATTMSRRLLVSRRRIVVIPRGREPDGLGSREDDRRHRMRSALAVGDKPLIVAAARHEAQKGLDVLIRAIPRVRATVPDARVLIGGRSGGTTAQLSELVSRLELEAAVEFIGQRDDIPDLMAAADVWCVPSRWEGFGGILVEAMALEVPVVASRIPPIVEVAGDPPVFELVRPDKPDDLADAIVAVLTAPDRSARLARRGRERFIDRFTIDRTSRATVDFFSEAISASRLYRKRAG